MTLALQAAPVERDGGSEDLAGSRVTVASYVDLAGEVARKLCLVFSQHLSVRVAVDPVAGYSNLDIVIIP